MKRDQPHARCVAAICELVEKIGGSAYRTHQGAGPLRKGGYRGLNATPGIPDLLLFMPPLKPSIGGHTLWCWEAKVGRDSVSEAQRVFHVLCTNASPRIFYCDGDLDDFIRCAQMAGYKIK